MEQGKQSCAQKAAEKWSELKYEEFTNLYKCVLAFTAVGQTIPVGYNHSKWLCGIQTDPQTGPQSDQLLFLQNKINIRGFEIFTW